MILDDPMAKAIGARIELVRKGLGFKFGAVFARELGISQSYLSEIEAGKKIPRRSILLLLQYRFGIAERWIFTGEGPERVTPFPVFCEEGLTLIPKVTGSLSGGPGSWELSPTVECYYAFRTDWIKNRGQPNHMKLMEVKGDSMYPVLQNGDYVLVDESQTTPLDGRLMAVMIWNEAMAKRIRVELDGMITILSENGERRGPLPQEQVTIIGRIVWLGRELR
jgi:phage repressor protein C with HTH and peptisase S24 domain